jgi:hypothetical protein
MAPGPRLTFGLVQFSDPPCTQVFRADEFEPATLSKDDEGKRKVAKVELKKGEPKIDVEGTVLKTGKCYP